MRIEFAGSSDLPDTVVLRINNDRTIDIAKYRAIGYLYFDVICIGGGGGQGGGVDEGDTLSNTRSYGGAGGGGGYHRVRGLLTALPSFTVVVVGDNGAVGSDAIDAASTTDGGDAGYSSFNSTTCRASGGKGGKRAATNNDEISTNADGGEGGVGDSITAGGGAVGGNAGTPHEIGPGTLGTPGEDGGLVDNIGEGGGGGAGGVGKASGATLNPGTSGGDGSYSSDDTSVYGPGLAAGVSPDTLSIGIVPGTAGGAKASPLNHLPTVFGRSGQNGVVIVRFTSE